MIQRAGAEWAYKGLCHCTDCRYTFPGSGCAEGRDWGKLKRVGSSGGVRFIKDVLPGVQLVSVRKTRSGGSTESVWVGYVLYDYEVREQERERELVGLGNANNSIL